MSRSSKRSGHNQSTDSKRTSPWIAGTIVVLVAGIIGFQLFKPLPEEPPSTEEQPAPTVPASLARPKLVDDPKVDGWETEQFSQLAQDQLQLVASFIADPSEQNLTAIARLAKDEFKGGSLRAEKSDTAFISSTLEVRRGAGSEGGDQVYAGPMGFITAIRDYQQPFANASNIHTKFKVVRIELAESTFDTKQLISISGEFDDRRFEEHATWHAVWSLSEPPHLLSLRSEDHEQVIVSTNTPPLVDCTASVLGEQARDAKVVNGIPDWWSTITKYYGVDMYGHNGIAIGDVNGDGLDDVYLCHPSRIPNQLFVQNADGTVQDRAAEFGVDILNPTVCALIVDVDNDQDQDLLLSAAGFIAVMKNSENNGFKLTSSLANDAQGHFTTRSLVAADYDIDGDLDVYACLSSFDIPLPLHDANNGSPNALWRNDGSGNFTDVTKEVGLDENNRRFSFAACWEDYDNDGDPDLYVANDFGRNNFYENQNGLFRDVARDRGVEDSAAGMSVSWGDFDQDQRLDLYVSNMFSSAGSRITFQRQFNPAAKQDARDTFRRHSRGNSLFRNSEGNAFEDVSVKDGVTMGRWSWCSRFTDINNDGWEDIFVVNGFLTNARKHDL